ncbi:unnamed protein product [Prunus armeniaca]
MEPWNFRDSLVVLVDACAGLDTREVEFHHRKVLEVDQADGVECMGRFLQVRTQLDVDQPLIRGAFVQFPDDGAKWADQDLTESKVEVLHNFSGLEAVEDLSGWRLRFGERNVSQGNNSTTLGGRWRHEHSSRLGEPRHLQQVGCWRDVGGAYMSRG